MKLFQRLLSFAIRILILIVLLTLYRAQPPHQAAIDTGDSQNPMHRQLGNPYALLTLIEYGDYECPFALAFERDTFPAIRSWLLNTGLIRYEFRDLPLPIHPGAPLAAKVMRCAMAQPVNIWNLHAKLFQGMDAGEWYEGDSEYASDSDGDGVLDDEATLQQYAAAAGVDINVLRACLKTATAANALAAQTDANFRRGIGSTPFFIFRSPLREDYIVEGYLTQPWRWIAIFLWRLLPLSLTKLFALWAIYTSIRQIIKIVRLRWPGSVSAAIATPNLEG